MFGSVGETAIDFLGAGSAQGSEHTGPPSFGWSLPARVLTLTGESEGYTRIERTLDLTTHSSEAPTLFILRR